MDYYSTMILLTVLIVFVLIITITLNNSFSKRIKKGFVLTFILVIIGACCEFVGSVYNGKILFENSQIDVFIHIFIKFSEQTLVPIIPVLFSKYIFESKLEKNIFRNVIIKFLGVYVILEIVLLLLGGKIFIVDSTNTYYHAELYHIYTVVFIITALYMQINALEFSKTYQNENLVQLIIIGMFMIVGISIQFINHEIKTCWLTIAIVGCFYYIYYNGTIQFIDRLTGLLNQRSYYAFLENNTDIDFILIICDVNNFKSINDQYGHIMGDKILSEIGGLLKNEYGKYGKCYRIGGDEFAIIIQNVNENLQKTKLDFDKALMERKKQVKQLPSIAVGYSVYRASYKNIRDIHSVQEEADLNMYKMKYEMKKQ